MPKFFKIHGFDCWSVDFTARAKKEGVPRGQTDRQTERLADMQIESTKSNLMLKYNRALRRVKSIGRENLIRIYGTRNLCF